jgi:thiamine-phosphate pyrophosphorylase
MFRVFDLAARRLYLCVGVRDDMAAFLPAVLLGGVDVVQLREKVLGAPEQLAAARIMVPICREFGVPFVMNDSPELAADANADGVHVGQDDVSVARCREVLGADAIVGLSTHSPEEFDGASLVIAGLRHFVVVRALTEAPEPEAAAHRLRNALDDALAVTVKPT